MSVINGFLIRLSDDTRNILYNAFVAIWFLTLFSLTLINCKKIKISTQNSMAASAITVITLTVFGTVANIVEDGLNMPILMSSSVLYYVPFLIVCVYSASKFIDCEKGELVDAIAISYFGARTAFLPACMFAGCCQGAEVTWGIYSAFSRAYVVPVQEIEYLISIVICILIQYYRKNSLSAKGKSAAFCLILFGFLNFVTDIFSIGYRKVFCTTSVEGIYAFLTMIIGLVLLYLIDNKKLQEVSAEAESCTN